MRTDREILRRLAPAFRGNARGLSVALEGARAERDAAVGELTQEIRALKAELRAKVDERAKADDKVTSLGRALALARRGISDPDDPRLSDGAE